MWNSPVKEENLFLLVYRVSAISSVQTYLISGIVPPDENLNQPRSKYRDQLTQRILMAPAIID